jgi:molybdenum cofactor biosynthesis enzyme MoaA
MIKSILCIGNGDHVADKKAKIIAIKNKMQYNGILETTMEDPSGCFHTSIYDLAYSDMLINGKVFDKVILLSQGKNEYKAISDYQYSCQVVHELGGDYEDETMMNQVIKYIENNNSYCIMPFTSLMVKRDEMSTCCFNKGFAASKVKFDFNSNADMRELRQQMLKDQKPKSCDYCYNLEDKGVKSPRQEWTPSISFSIDYGNSFDKVDLRNYDIRLGNQCNLMCRMCNQYNSHLIDEEFFKLGITQQMNGVDDLDNFDSIALSTVNRVYVAGGEPTIDKTFHNFLNKCIELKLTDFEIVVNTNAAVISDNFLDLCSHFSNIKFEISIDGYKNVNTYVRWPQIWDKLVENIEKLYTVSNKKISFGTVVSIYNVCSLHELVEFLSTKYPKHDHHMQYVQHGTILQAWHYPFKEYAKMQLQKIQSLGVYSEQQHLRTKIDGIIDLLDSETVSQQELHTFFHFNDLLDQSRKIHLKDYIPELEKCRELITKPI